MTNIDKPPRRRRFLIPVLGALAVVAAGAVLYGTVAPAGKAASDCPADSTKLAARLAPLAQGGLAGLPGEGGPGFEVVAVNVDTAKLERRAAFLDSVGVKSLTRYSDSSGDAFETLHKDGKALGLPLPLVIDKDGCEVAAVEGGAKWDSAEAQALVAALKGG